METPVTRCASTRGPEMLQITGAKTFCIDATEVTAEQFAEYAKVPPTIAMPARCAGVVLTYPTTDANPKAPQFNVTWCDAFAYCAWAGKRLCGVLDKGKPIGSDNSEWTYVCTQGGKTAFPYGDTYDAAACVVGRPDPMARPEPVTSFGNCTGDMPPYSDIYDLSGNVSEWVDECVGTSCRALGGFFGDSDQQSLKCASISGTTGKTNELDIKSIYSGLGFRCCMD
jgi:formylglycine-generating enzyme